MPKVSIAFAPGTNSEAEAILGFQCHTMVNTRLHKSRTRLRERYLETLEIDISCTPYRDACLC